MKVFPVPGRLVRDPATGLELGTEGFDITDTDAFWLRRLADGDVTDTGPEASPAAKATVTKGEK